MISKSELKLIRALKSKKQRDKLNLFVAEGAKLVEHFVANGLNAKNLFSLNTYSGDLKSQSQLVSEKEMKMISSLESNSPIIGVFEKPSFQSNFSSEIVMALDDVRDPGNMGTIIRLADWFGVKTLFCSPNCVDVFNKAIASFLVMRLGCIRLSFLVMFEID